MAQSLWPPALRQQFRLYNPAAKAHVNKPAIFRRTLSPSLESWHNEYQDASQRMHKK